MPIRDRIAAATAALLGISAYAPAPRQYGGPSPELLERMRREQGGGNLAAQAPIPTRWYLSDLEDASVAADGGYLRRAAELMAQARTDGVVAGVLSTRTSGLVRLPKVFRGDPEIVEALELGHEETRSVFDEMCPASDLAQIAADGELLGIGVGELVPVVGRDFPLLIRQDPKFLRWVWHEGHWFYDGAFGPEPIVPGDGRWVLHTPGGRNQPWQNGLWKAVGRAYIRKDHAANHKDSWEGKLAHPARVAVAPQGSTPEQRGDFMARLMAWGINSVFTLLPGYDIRLVESNGRGYESFVQTIQDQNYEITICIAGQTVTTDGGAGFSNADIHKSIRADLIMATADALALTINTQILPQFIVQRWGEERLSPGAYVAWDVTPPQDRNAEAAAYIAAATSVSQLREALAVYGIGPDVEAICARMGVPVRKLELAEAVDLQRDIATDEADEAAPADAAEAPADDAAADTDAVEPDSALNGAQVASLLEIVQQVARRELPRESGISMILTAFPVTREQAEDIMGEVGRSFFLESDTPDAVEAA